MERIGLLLLCIGFLVPCWAFMCGRGNVCRCKKLEGGKLGANCPLPADGSQRLDFFHQHSFNQYIRLTIEITDPTLSPRDLVNDIWLLQRYGSVTFKGHRSCDFMKLIGKGCDVSWFLISFHCDIFWLV